MTNLEKNSDNNWLGKMLLGIVGNVTLQATQKHLTKENFFETSIVGALAGLAGNAIGRSVSDGEGFGSGAAAGSTAATILSLGNAIINKKNDFANDFATIGTLALVDGVAREIKSGSKNRPTDFRVKKRVRIVDNAEGNYPHPIFGENGVILLSQNWQLGSGKYSRGFQFEITKLAFEIASQTPIVKKVFSIFKDSDSALSFMESNATGHYHFGRTFIRLRDLRSNAFSEIKNFKSVISKINKNIFSMLISIDLYPIELQLNRSNLTFKQQVALLSIIIGHELFIHGKCIDAARAWIAGDIEKAFDIALSDSGPNGGDFDHKNYMLGKNVKMKKYLSELKSYATKKDAIVSLNDVIVAQKNHDTRYNYLIGKK